MNAIYTFSNQPYEKKKLVLLFLVSFFIRGLTFYIYVQNHERYKQADSSDYHICAFSLAKGLGMFHPQHHKPLFWRTPGYPAYLAIFYKYCGTSDIRFQGNIKAQKISIWLQIFLCSFIPILVFFLALLLTSSSVIAWISSLIFVFHPGFILASCYLLTDGLAMIFFLLFLLFFYKSFTFLKEQKKISDSPIIYWVFAAIALSIYTWMRPNGEFIAFIALFIFLFSANTLRQKCIKIIVFATIFFTCLSPWYVRNHNLTGYWFFCPMSGAYHLAFSAPKILHRLTNQPLENCLKYLFVTLKTQLEQEEKKLALTNPELFVSRELVCKKIAYPIITKYPHYVCIDWIYEVCKTTFDLYSHQLVTFVNNSFMHDPIEEFLTEKIKNCLYKNPMPVLMRFICWLEFLFSILLWFGLIGGIIIFILQAFINFFRQRKPLSDTTYLWIKTGLMIGGLLFMTGGFGYARLRMPAEPLMVLLSLTFWLYFLKEKKQIFYVQKEKLT
jgi:4-amino-4-deoxy-L-arabinose transferase-like glycosyltransferase